MSNVRHLHLVSDHAERRAPSPVVPAPRAVFSDWLRRIVWPHAPQITHEAPDARAVVQKWHQVCFNAGSGDASATLADANCAESAYQLLAGVLEKARANAPMTIEEKAIAISLMSVEIRYFKPGASWHKR